MGKRKPSIADEKQEVRLADDVHLTIAISSGGVMQTPAAVALAVAVPTTGVPLRIDVEQSCYVHKNRNILMKRALESKSTHMLFLDEDIVFPPDGIMRLLAHGRSVVGGAYNTRKPAGDNGHMVTTVKPLPGTPEAEEGSLLDTSEPFKVRAIPTGFMLIDLNVIRGLDAPPLDGGKADGSDGGGHAKWFDFGDYSGFVGEDVYFCDYVRKQGIEVWCDPTIPLGHVGEQVY